MRSERTTGSRSKLWLSEVFFLVHCCLHFEVSSEFEVEYALRIAGCFLCIIAKLFLVS